MTTATLLLLLCAFLLGVPLTLYARRLGRRIGAMDGAGVSGQVKEAVRRVPNTGGIAVFWCVAGPLLVLLVMVKMGWEGPLVSLVPEVEPHLERVRGQVAGYGWLLVGMGVLHVMGLIDDRRPLGAWPKLVVMLGVAGGYAWFSGTRVLTVLDGEWGGAGVWLSLLVTVGWIVVVTNALNFIDNMDGLCGGVAVVAGLCFMSAALLHQQWFVAGVLALLVGGCLGFLVFNFPLRRPASIFLGDGGSLVVGFVLAVMAVRITYARSVGEGVDMSVANPHALLTPLVVLAVPLYDMLSVTFLRLRQGRSPFVGDLQHLSHRLHFGGIEGPGGTGAGNGRGGLTKRDTVVIICGLTAITGLGGIALASLQAWQACLIFAQTVAALVLLGVWEYRAAQSARVRGGDGA